MSDVVSELRDRIASRLVIIEWPSGARLTADYVNPDGTKVRLETLFEDDLETRLESERLGN